MGVPFTMTMEGIEIMTEAETRRGKDPLRDEVSQIFDIDLHQLLEMHTELWFIFQTPNKPANFENACKGSETNERTTGARTAISSGVSFRIGGRASQ